MKKILSKDNLNLLVETLARLFFLYYLVVRAVDIEALNSKKFELLFYLAIGIVIITSVRNTIQRVRHDPMQLKLLMYMAVLFPIIILVIVYLF